MNWILFEDEKPKEFKPILVYAGGWNKTDGWFEEKDLTVKPEPICTDYDEDIEEYNYMRVAEYWGGCDYSPAGVVTLINTNEPEAAYNPIAWMYIKPFKKRSN